MKEGSYKVKTKHYVFLLDIIEYDNYVCIKYGDVNDKEGPCMELCYDKNNGILKLEHVFYDSRCSTKPMKRKSGTREMIKSALKICVDNFKVKKTIFNDVSSIKCEGSDLHLAYFYILTKGATWYETYFGAKPSSRRLKEYIDKAKRFLLQKPSLSAFSFYKTETAHADWKSFFESQPCEFLQKHQDEIERKLGMRFLYTEWKIQQTIISEYDVEILSIKPIKDKPMFGGRLSTRYQRF